MASSVLIPISISHFTPPPAALAQGPAIHGPFLIAGLFCIPSCTAYAPWRDRHSEGGCATEPQQTAGQPCCCGSKYLAEDCHVVPGERDKAIASQASPTTHKPLAAPTQYQQKLPPRPAQSPREQSSVPWSKTARQRQGKETVSWINVRSESLPRYPSRRLDGKDAERRDTARGTPLLDCLRPYSKFSRK